MRLNQTAQKLGICVKAFVMGVQCGFVLQMEHQVSCVIILKTHAQRQIGKLTRVIDGI